MMRTDVWNYRDESLLQSRDIVGYDVEAMDGSIGKIDAATFDTDQSHIVVDTGFWIFGKKRLIPARAVKGINPEQGTVFVDLTKAQIKDAPDYDAARWSEDRVGYEEYYGPLW